MFLNLMFTIMLFTFLLFFIFLSIQFSNTLKNKEKTSFECGFLSKNIPQNSFSINYFYITIIFMIFDLEVLMIMPILLFKVKMLTAISLAILAAYFNMLLAMEWQASMFEWDT